MIRIRMHRGGLQESMETMKECHKDNPECLEYLKSHGVDISTIKSEWYCEKDERVGWEPVYIITGRYTRDISNNIYPLAFSDYIVVKQPTKDELDENFKLIEKDLKNKFGNSFELL